MAWYVRGGVVSVVLGSLVLVGAAGCGGTPRAAGSGSPSAGVTESVPPGDIPDNVAYVRYTSAAGRYSFEHPEGWASTQRGAAVTFTDKLNGITASPATATAAPTVASARAGDLPALRGQAGFALVKVGAVTLPAGSGVLIVYRRDSKPDPVTGNVHREEVQRYEVFGHGHRLDLDLYGAVGSDNVDPYARISRSVTLS